MNIGELERMPYLLYLCSVNQPCGWKAFRISEIFHLTHHYNYA